MFPPSKKVIRRSSRGSVFPQVLNHMVVDLFAADDMCTNVTRVYFRPRSASSFPVCLLGAPPAGD